MASTRWVNSIIARVSGGGSTCPPSARGQDLIERPDPLRRTMPPQTTSTNTSTTVPVKSAGRRLGFTVLLADDRDGVEVLRRRRGRDLPLQGQVVLRVSPGIGRRGLAAPEAPEHVDREQEHAHAQDRGARAGDRVPARELG